ncbi:hypothetical protein [Sphingomonas sp. Leaf231]|nr:hypothetical protein [Sphingomonas sp. Leaf231]
MVVPAVRLLSVTRAGIGPVALEDEDHFRLHREFTIDPLGTMQAMRTE